MRFKSVLALALSFYLGVGVAGSPHIGTAIAKGAFRVDNATVNGNATLFEGSLLETATAASSIQLTSGARLLLGAESRGHLFGDRLVLEKGTTNLENGTGFRLVALGLTIRPERGTSAALVTLEGTRRVRVASARGGLRVLNSKGEVVANLAAGSALAFEPQAQGLNEITHVTGRLENLSGHYVLVDEVTHVAVEVVGPGIAKEVGNRVEIFGAADRAATPTSDATQVIRVRELHSLGKAVEMAKSASKAVPAGRAAPANTAPASTGTAAASAGTTASTGTAAASTGTAVSAGTAAASTGAAASGVAVPAGTAVTGVAVPAGTAAAHAGATVASTAAHAGTAVASTAVHAGAAVAGAAASTAASVGAIGAGTAAIVGGVGIAAVTGGLAAAAAGDSSTGDGDSGSLSR